MLNCRFLGPSTERDAVGTAVEFVLNPLSYVIAAPDIKYRNAAVIGSALQTRTPEGRTV